MKYSNIYQTLEPGKFFFTVWVTLPQIVVPIIQKDLKPIIKYLSWASTFTADYSKKNPHITLRYLGHESEKLKQQLIKDKSKFQKVIREIPNQTIKLGKMMLWTEYDNNLLITARLNWNIEDKSALIEIHKRLLTIDGYAFFTSLEDENFSPHISLGKIDLSIPSAYEKVKEYLDHLNPKPLKVNLENYALNLAFKDHSEEISLNINTI